MPATWSSGQVAAGLVRFIVAHPGSLGLGPGIEPDNLGLTPHHNFRSDAGALALLRFDQTYRGLPVFGPDAVVKLVATPEGAIGLRGAIVDGREEFRHIAEPSTAANAAVSIRFHVAQQTGLATDDLELNDLRLVAVPRAQAIGWAASVDRGLVHVATVVVEADPKYTTPHSKLLYFDDDVDEGLDDEVAVEVMAEGRASDVIDEPVTAMSQSVKVDGMVLKGSQSGDRVALADGRVVAYNAVDATEAMDLAKIPPFSAPDASFQALPGTREFRVQDAYVAAQNFYTWTDRFMAGRWDSHRGAASSFAPGQYGPRLMVYENVGFDFCGPQSFCASFHNITPQLQGVADEYKQPLDGPVFEKIGYFAVEDTAGVSAPVLAHEFGHVIDYFADPGAISVGFGCKDCVPTCEPDTTDESGALVESFANFAALWLLRDLYAVGQSPTSCAVTIAVSRGGSRLPHVQGCTDGNTAKVALFLPSGAPKCAGFACDALGPEDAAAATGICSAGPGYRVDSFHQALWEALHAHTCEVSAPYSCVSRPALVSEPAGDIVGGALLYALRVNTGTYRGFADDMATHIACNHSEAAYQAFNEIFCHHAIRACDAPTPALCETCGNGITEGKEACDGTDLGGQSCEELGFAGGALMCDATCSLDESGCVTDIPTTGAETAEPTSEGPTGPGIVLDSDATAGGVADDGCGCRSAPAGSWLPALLGGALLRRRRRAVRGLVAIGTLLATEAACGPTTPTHENDATATSTATSSSTGDAPGEVSPRMFGEFHLDNDYVGQVISEPKDDPLFWYPWWTHKIERDGSLQIWWNSCQSLTEVQTFAWEHAGGDMLRVVPDEYNSDGTFRYIAVDVMAVTLRPGSGCDDLQEVIEYHPDSGKSTYTSRYLPGELCFEDDTPADADDCNFTFVWCDGMAPPACTGEGA